MRNISCESVLLLNQNRATCNYLNISLTQIHLKSQNSAVGIVARLQDGHRINHGWIRERGKRFSVSSQRTDQAWVQKNIFCAIGTGDLSLGLKRPAYEVHKLTSI